MMHSCVYECMYSTYACMNLMVVARVCPVVMVMYVCMYVCTVCMSFPQMRHCNIAPLHQLGICHNNVTVDNTFPTCFGGVQVWDTK